MTEIVENPVDLIFSAPEAKGRAHQTLPAEAASDLRLLSTNPRFIDRPRTGFGLHIKLGHAPIIVDSHKWTKDGEFDFDEKTTRRFSFIVVKTPPISEANQKELEDVLKKASKFLSVQVGNKATRRDPRAASVFVIEEGGKDTQKGARIELLKSFDLVRAEANPDDKDGPAVWLASRKRESKRQEDSKLPAYPIDGRSFRIEADNPACMCGDCGEHLWGKLQKKRSGEMVLERWCPNHRERAELPNISPSVLGRFRVR